MARDIRRNNTTRMKARFPTDHCPRCAEPIRVGQEIEPYLPPGADRRVFAHWGCSRVRQEYNRRTRQIREVTVEDDVDDVVVSDDARRGGAEIGRREMKLPGRAEAAGDGDGDGSGETGGEGREGGERGEQGGQDQGDQDRPGEGGPEDRLLEKAAERVQKRLESKMNQIARAAGQNVSSQVMNQIAQEMRQEIDGLRREMQKAQESVFQKAGEGLEEAVEAAKEGILKDLAERGEAILKHVHVIQRPDGTEEELPGDEVYHEAFDEVLRLVQHGFPVFLPGPTGCGKTHLARQVARTLGLPFGLVSGSAGTTEVELLGRSIPNTVTGESVYLPSPFITCYEQGGVFLLDEADGMDPNCLLKLNAALANKFCPVPNRFHNPIAEQHPKFAVIAAANTLGQGPSRQYRGRFPLDEATLDRFRFGTVEMRYDPNVEVRYACPDLRLYKVFVGWRQKMDETRSQRILSTRFIRDAYIGMKVLGYTLRQVAAKLSAAWSVREKMDVFGFDPAAPE